MGGKALAALTSALSGSFLQVRCLPGDAYGEYDANNLATIPRHSPLPRGALCRWTRRARARFSPRGSRGLQLGAAVWR
jgi:hypothetical protein